MPVLPYPLDGFGYCVTSQNNEDGVIDAIARHIPMRRYFVEFGAEALQCNCLELRRKGWDGLFMDAKGDNDFIKCERITPDNINPLLKKYRVPDDFGLLSIDIDGQDIWVWRAMTCQPPLVIIEFNNSMESGETPRDDNFQGQGQLVWGASLRAMNEVGESKGYILVWANHVNAFFIRRELLDNPEDFGIEKCRPHL
jgi:hypothetical protein